MSFLTTNRCTRTRIQTKDGVVIQLFSAFYDHPAMVNEDAWHLVKHGSFNLLVDEDTMEIMNGLECEWGFSANSDTIVTCKLSSHEKDEEKRNHDMGIKFEYAKKVRRSMKSFFDASKVDELSLAVDAIDINELDDSGFLDNGQVIGNTPANQA